MSIGCIILLIVYMCNRVRSSTGKPFSTRAESFHQQCDSRSFGQLFHGTCERQVWKPNPLAPKGLLGVPAEAVFAANLVTQPPQPAQPALKTSSSGHSGHFWYVFGPLEDWRRTKPSGPSTWLFPPPHQASAKCNNRMPPDRRAVTPV